MASPHRRRLQDLVLWWHAGWTGAVGVGVGLLVATGVLQPDASVAALALGFAPAVLGLALSPPKDGSSRVLILVSWALGGGLASLLTGGAAGPLAAWCLAPMAAAAMLRRTQLLALGAALSIGAATFSTLAGLLLQIPPPDPSVAHWLGLLSLSTTVVGLGAGLVALHNHAVLDERKRGQSEARIKAVLADAPLLLVSVDDKGQVLGAFGQSPRGVATTPMMGDGLVAAAAPGDQAAVAQALKKAFAEDAAEVGFVPAGEPEGWAIMMLRRINAHRVAVAIRDGSGQRAHEVELETARDAAETANAGKSRFLANMSHELRTPLNAIMGFSDIMRQRLFGPLPDRYGDYADMIHESGEHLLELINDVLDMSKIEAERYELSREAFDARDAISAVLRLMRGQADRAGVQLRGVLPKEPLTADADRRALKQITLNLVSNALKFTPRGGSVTVTADRSGDSLELVVADTGLGMTPEDLKRVGRPYEQAGGAAQKAEGTGLGLSLVRAFAQLHGGELALESKLGEGTTATVRLPVLVAEPARETVSEPAS